MSLSDEVLGEGATHWESGGGRYTPVEGQEKVSVDGATH